VAYAVVRSWRGRGEWCRLYGLKLRERERGKCGELDDEQKEEGEKNDFKLQGLSGREGEGDLTECNTRLAIRTSNNRRSNLLSLLLLFFLLFLPLTTSTLTLRMTYSAAQFDKAVALIACALFPSRSPSLPAYTALSLSSLPEDGPVKPSQDDKLTVHYLSSTSFTLPTPPSATGGPEKRDDGVLGQ
jgi:hypothetical protein